MLYKIYKKIKILDIFNKSKKILKNVDFCQILVYTNK